MSAPASAALSKLTSAPIDRRERRPVSMSGYALFDDGTTAEILVVDLSYDGCGIEVPVELTAGQHVKLSVLRRGVIEADVRWYRGGKAGLVFRAEPAPEAHCQPRVDERVSLTAEVRLRRLGKANFRVGLFDVSPHGCKVELVERPALGEHLLVKFAELEPLQAEVCWVEDFCAGLRFVKPMHPAVFELLVERLR
jgi:hypothetical protein